MVFLAESCQEGGRSQLDVRIKGWPQRKRLWSTGEIPNSDKVPIIAASFGYCELVSGDVERRSLPTVRGLYLDHPLAAVGFEAGDIVAEAIAVLF